MATQPGVLGAIEIMGRLNEGKTDKESAIMVKQIIKAIETRNSKWPSNELCKHVYNMDSTQTKLFLDVLKDMDFAFDEHFGLIR